MCEPGVIEIEIEIEIQSGLDVEQQFGMLCEEYNT